MIPKLHKKGKSFAGAAAYLLHDKNATTTHRVAWTETRNLATNSPDAAWRVMAATALDQRPVEAGSGHQGHRPQVQRQRSPPHPFVASGRGRTVTREEMMAAAEGAITTLQADNHQALFVCHDDEPQPHLHILINRVSPDDGRFLTSSKERLKLSQWAEQYERGRGQIYCEERVANNAARARGNYVRGQKDRPRHIFELEAANDNGTALWAQKVRQEQFEADQALRRKSDAQNKRHSAQWRKLDETLAAKKLELRKSAKRKMTIVTQAVGDRFEDQFAQLALQQHEDREEFVAREETLFGKGLNILRSIDWTGLLRQERRSVAIKEAFGLLGGRVGRRSEALRRAQQRETMELEHKMHAAKTVAAELENRRQKRRLQTLRQKYLVARQKLLARQQLEDAWLKGEWQTRTKERELAWERARQREATHEFEREATPEEERQKKAERFMGRMRRAREERERECGKGKLKNEFERSRDRDGWER